MVTNNVNLLDFSCTPSWNTSFRSTRLRGSGVTKLLRWRYIYRRCSRSLPDLSDIGNGGAIEGFAHTHTRSLEFCFSMSSFTDLLPEKVMLARSDVLLPEPEGYHHHEGREHLKVAGSKQSANGITDIFIINVSPVRTGILRRAAPTATR